MIKILKNKLPKNIITMLNIALLFLTGLLIQINIVIPIFLTSLYFYCRIKKLNTFRIRFLYIAFLFLLGFGANYFIIKAHLPLYCLPYSIIAMLSTLLFASLEISLIITTAIAISTAGIYGNSIQIAILFLISGIFSSILILGARKRSTIINSSLIIGVIQLISIIFITNSFSAKDISAQSIFLLNSLICGIIVLGVLPIFEYFFNTVTNISLLELADFNHPLLQRLTLEAPGTYHHSLLVGNLSESACRAIGANALLARIGAYYHDIGKLSKPEYFSENQLSQENKHDNLTPTMSKLIIMNHVKEGIDLACIHKLNPALIEFISRHHGSSLVYYFYRKALETIEEDQEVKEEGFRYCGPKPNTKETAVVLLADSVEAAARALRNPAPTKIAEVTHKIINNKFIDGQLDECDLTLKDLEKISSTFIHILSGIYHSRLNYPSRVENFYK